MLGVYVSVPIACFRKGLAREYLETEALPPPATCYGFLLSLVGEERRRRHVGCRIAPVLLNRPDQSVVLRTVWRVKSLPLGAGGNTRPDFQQLLAPVRLVLWLESSEELGDGERLESRVVRALERPETIERFGGLSLGESAHLIDEVRAFPRTDRNPEDRQQQGRAFLVSPSGRMTLPVWVDHVGSAGTRYATGNLLESGPVQPPPVGLMPRITQ
jgi:CRISPR-associated protein Cas5t